MYVVHYIYLVSPSFAIYYLVCSVLCVVPSSAKVVVHLARAPPDKPQGPAVLEKAGHIRLSFRKGGQPEVHTHTLHCTSAKTIVRCFVLSALITPHLKVLLS